MDALEASIFLNHVGFFWGPMGSSGAANSRWFPAGEVELEEGDGYRRQKSVFCFSLQSRSSSRSSMAICSNRSIALSTKLLSHLDKLGRPSLDILFSAV